MDMLEHQEGDRHECVEVEQGRADGCGRVGDELHRRRVVIQRP